MNFDNLLSDLNELKDLCNLVKSDKIHDDDLTEIKSRMKWKLFNWIDNTVLEEKKICDRNNKQLHVDDTVSMHGVLGYVIDYEIDEQKLYVEWHSNKLPNLVDPKKVCLIKNN